MPSKIKKIVSNKNICIVFDEKDKSAMQFEKYTATILEKLYKFYKIKNPQINIELVYSREEFDDKLEYKTPKWLVAIVEDNDIYLFSPSVIEKVSNHKKSEIKKLFTHEICHVFNSKINMNNLMWVDEGVALFIAKQKKEYFSQKDLDFFIRNYLNKNISLQLFAENNGYNISYWMIRMIVKKFGEGKLLELLRINPKT